MGKAYNTVLDSWFDWYVDPEDIEDWLDCKQCGYKPKVWEVDNVRLASCACAEDYSKYNKRTIEAESIGELLKRTGGDIRGYDDNELKDKWNSWVMGSEK